MSEQKTLCETCRFRVLVPTRPKKTPGESVLMWAALCPPMHGRCDRMKCDFYEREPGSDDE